MLMHAEADDDDDYDDDEMVLMRNEQLTGTRKQTFQTLLNLTNTIQSKAAQTK